MTQEQALAKLQELVGPTASVSRERHIGDYGGSKNVFRLWTDAGKESGKILATSFISFEEALALIPAGSPFTADDSEMAEVAE
jgi:hypothetical protein